MTPEEKKLLQKVIAALQQLAGDGNNNEDSDVDRTPPKTEPEDARAAQRRAMGLAPASGAPKTFRVTPTLYQFSVHALAESKARRARA